MEKTFPNRYFAKLATRMRSCNILRQYRQWPVATGQVPGIIRPVECDEAQSKAPVNARRPPFGRSRRGLLSASHHRLMCPPAPHTLYLFRYTNSYECSCMFICRLFICVDVYLDFNTNNFNEMDNCSQSGRREF